jgi:hypothetical protein
MDGRLVVGAIFLMFSVASASIFSCRRDKPAINNDIPKTGGNVPENKKTFNYFAFDSLRDEFKAPDWWTNLHQQDSKSFPVFALSQHYPAEKPSPVCPESECGWKRFDFKTESREYLIEALKYSFEGNLEIDWNVRENSLRRWFHAPWMHTTRYGREFIHGLTRERQICKEELLGKTICPSGSKKYQSWAVGIYNTRGAYYIGKVWEEMLKENPDPQNFPAEAFPEGSVSLKLLFTQADETVAPYLADSFEWLADAKRAKKNNFPAGKCVASSSSELSAECFDKLRLLQIDVAVRDDRAATGWIFGTFTYHHGSPPIFDYPFAPNIDEVKKKNLQRWLSLEFVGLMYGNDENVLPGGGLRESVVNEQNPVKQHLGCGGRVNGAVDNPVSSCMSCHSLAETPKNLSIETMPYQDLKCSDAEIARWFRNINPRDADAAKRTFTGSENGREIFSLDYSLQLREGIMRFCEENRNRCGLPEKNSESVSLVTRAGVEEADSNRKDKKQR